MARAIGGLRVRVRRIGCVADSDALWERRSRGARTRPTLRGAVDSRSRARARRRPRDMQRKRGRVFADIWDLQPFASCPSCFEPRRDRLRRMNLEQRVLPAASCAACDPTPRSV